MQKKKRKPYTKTAKCLERTNKITNWSKRAAIYSLKTDQGKSVREIAKIYDLSTQRVGVILRDCKVKMKPE